MPDISFPYMEWARTHSLLPQEDVINLAVSEVSWVTPEEFPFDRSILTMDRKTSYIQLEETREALSKRYGVNTQEIFISLGASGTNFLVFGAIFDYGDEVLIEYPTYQAFLSLASFYKLNVKRFKRDLHDDYAIDMDSIKAITTPKTKGIIISNCHNPSGFALSKKNLDDLISYCDANGIWLLSDDIYLDATVNGLGATSFRSGSRIITTQSFTKVFGLGALRLGWAFAPTDIVKRMIRFEYISYVELPAIWHGLCLQVFPYLERFYSKRIKQIQENRGIFIDWLSSKEQLVGRIPPYGVITFLRFKDGKTIADTEDWERRHRILVASGEAFGDRTGFRLGYSMSKESLIEGLSRLDNAIQ